VKGQFSNVRDQTRIKEQTHKDTSKIERRNWKRRWKIFKVSEKITGRIQTDKT
jgi:hypothetical protein